MNLLLLMPDECNERVANIAGKRVQSVIERHDLKPGLELTGGVFNGKIGRVVVTAVNRDEINLEVDLIKDPPAKRKIDLIVSIARPQTIKKVIHLACTLGVRSLSFIKTDNVEKSYLSSKQLNVENIKLEVIKGLEQAVDTVAPQIEVFKSISHWKSGMLDKCPAADSALKVVADTKNNTKLITEFSPFGTVEALLAIGPETGWSNREINLWNELSFKSVSLGERMLRVDTAVSFLVAQSILFTEN